MADRDEVYELVQAKAAQVERVVAAPQRPVPHLTPEQEEAYTAALRGKGVRKREFGVGVALGFFDHGGNAGAHPGLRLLSRKAGYKPQKCKDALSELYDRGAIERVKIASGMGAYHCYYRVPVECWPERAAAHRAEKARKVAARERARRVVGTIPLPEAVADEVPSDRDLAA